MRLSRYRGKSIEDGQWVRGSLIQTGTGAFIVNGVVECSSEYIALENWMPVERVTVGQFTGLKDKNGVEIYENDLISDHVGIGYVEWKDSGYRVNYRDGYCKWFIDYLKSERPSIEVIGNVYEVKQ